ncbi:cupredoxin domain-containing protein [Terrimonas pollutisoli]|uniref:cupredoxin domain-containing protein n=1 Tax=Terrimonas pollutisoli TaxID=3034147 RepID=UPI0023ED2E8E|nr:hypothetical protein [Terrimonas sp. H1YJ31]
MKKINRLIDKAGCGLLVFSLLLFSACSPDFDTGPDFGQGGCLGCGGSFSNTIYIMGHGFAPDSMAVQKGQMVTWHNTDTIPHSIICTDFSGPLLRICQQVVSIGIRHTTWVISGIVVINTASQEN